MTLYQRVDGAWVPASMAYVKVNEVWTPATNAYVKRSGVWTTAHTYDVVPPPPPELTLQIVERFKGSGANKDLTGRWINVGVRMPGVSNRPDIRRVRVLTTYNGDYPTGYSGGTYTSAAAENYSGEPWSEWRFNGFGPHHGDTSVISQKRWPRNAADTFKLKPGQVYHFTAWAEDFAGNWSPGVYLKVTGPKLGIDAANVITKQARFQAIGSGSLVTGGYTAGSLVQSAAPYSQGIWFHGTQIIDAIGEAGTPSITTAQLRVIRENDDGQATANVYVAAHPYSTSGAVPATGRSFTTPVKLGTISKGESKWFELPDSMHAALNTTTRGFTLLTKDPSKATAGAADYSKVTGIDGTLRSGELVVTWTEKL